MLRLLFLCSLIFGCASFLTAQVPFLETKNHRAQSLFFGTTDTADFRFKSKKITRISLPPHPNNISLVSEHLLPSAPDDTLDILLYLHCMWGGQQFYHRQVLRSLAPDLLTPAGSIDRILPLIWHSGMSYKRNLKKARKIGHKTGDLLGEIMRQVRQKSPQPVRFHLLCHSMGHQVLRGILAENADNPAFTFSQIIFAAADVDYDIFADEEDFAALLPRAERITVFVNQNDKALKASFKKNGAPRLGRSGLKDAPADKIRVIDVTEIDDIKGLAAKVSGHGYFIASDTVKRMIFSRFVR